MMDVNEEAVIWISICGQILRRSTLYADEIEAVIN